MYVYPSMQMSERNPDGVTVKCDSDLRRVTDGITSNNDRLCTLTWKLEIRTPEKVKTQTHIHALSAIRIESGAVRDIILSLTLFKTDTGFYGDSSQSSEIGGRVAIN